MGHLSGRNYSKLILENIHHKQICDHEDQSDTEQQQPEGHTPRDHRAVLRPFFIDHGELMVVVYVSGPLPAVSQITDMLEEGGNAGAHMGKGGSFRQFLRQLAVLVDGLAQQYYDRIHKTVQ